MGPLVSIIIPNFNGAKYLKFALDSCLLQEYKNIEIIVVDNGSIDTSLGVLREYVEKHHNIKAFVELKKGGGYARNRGIRESKGKYLQFLDSDDLLSRDKIKAQVALLEENYSSKRISYTSYTVFRENPFSDDTIVKNPCRGVSYTDGLTFIVDVLGNSWLQTSCWLIPRELAGCVGEWNVRLQRNQDGDFFSRIILASSEGIFSKNGMVYYRWNPHGISKKPISPAIAESMLESLGAQYNYILEYGEQKDRIYIARKLFDLSLALGATGSKSYETVLLMLDELGVEKRYQMKTLTRVFLAVLGTRFTYRIKRFCQGCREQ